MTSATLSLPRPRLPLSYLAATVAAVAVGWLAARTPYAAVALACLPIIVWLVLRPAWAVVGVAGALPLMVDLIGGEGSSVIVSPPDVLVAIAVVGAVAPLLLDAQWRERLRAAKPLWVWSVPFTAWILVSLAAHPSAHTALNSLQEVSLYLAPLLLGAVVIGRREAPWVMRAFVAAALILAIGWAASGGHGFLGQKNPAGQYIADAILLVLATHRTWRSRLPLLLVLVVGLFFTGSRGAILGIAAGCIALLACRGFGSWRRTAAAVLPLILITVLGFNLIPDSAQQRLTSLSGGQSADVTAGVIGAAEYSVRLRTDYRSDGVRLADAHPLLGVGVGNYVTGSAVTGTQTADPHNVLIRTAADLGAPGLVGFAALVLGTAWVAVRRTRVSPWAVAALAVQVSTITHGMVDVYWVRGTPVLAWLLLGFVLNKQLTQRSAT